VFEESPVFGNIFLEQPGLLTLFLVKVGQFALVETLSVVCYRKK